MADAKEIAVNASVDIGKNITELVEKLANQIGTTADKVFPWYVKQQVIEGWAYMITSGAVLVLGTLILVLFFRKADWDDGNRYSFVVVAGSIITIVAFLFFVIGLPSSLAQIINPQYYALKSMTCDMAKLLGL